MLLVDTGLAVTLVHKRLLEGSRGTGEGLQEISGGPVVVANGQPLQVLGVIRSNFNVAGTEFSHDTLVTEDVSLDPAVITDVQSLPGLSSQQRCCRNSAYELL